MRGNKSSSFAKIVQSTRLMAEWIGDEAEIGFVVGIFEADKQRRANL